MEKSRGRWGPGARPVRDENLVARQVAGRTLLVHVRSGAADLDHLFVLNDTAAWIWERVDGRRDVAQLLGELVSAFDVEGTRAQNDLEALLRRLHEAGLLHHSD